MEGTVTYKKELYLEVLKLMHRKSSHINEILRLSSEISNALARDDRVSVQMLIGMRGDEMDAVDEEEKNLHLLVSSVPDEYKKELSALVERGVLPESGPEEAERIAGIRSSMRSSIEKAVAIDKVMNSRLAGKDSFYQ